MAFGIGSVIKLLTSSGALEEAAKVITGRFRKSKNGEPDFKEIKTLFELQSELNEKVESRLRIIQDSIFKTQKILRGLLIITFFALIFSITALIIILFK